MKFLDLTLSTPGENLALDEALLDGCNEFEAEEYNDGPFLRFWESPDTFVVLGRSGQFAQEVCPASCKDLKIPVLRRCSGGGTVVQGPGCLNYSLSLKITEHAGLSDISKTNNFILNHHKDAIQSLTSEKICFHEITDLAIGNLKFSGNAQRRKRRAVLFHGTFLYNFDIDLVEKLLPLPKRQPTYRNDRPHAAFMTNLKFSPDQIKQCLKDIWNAQEPLKKIPHERISRLLKKYQEEFRIL